MGTKVAVNGLGRIGRSILKLVLDEPAFELVAVNDLVDADNLAYLLRFDTVYGRYDKPVVVDERRSGGRRAQVANAPKPRPAGASLEEARRRRSCSSARARSSDAEDVEKHIQAGARTVLLSAPSKEGEVETVIPGVNSGKTSSTVISCASCTTNCITPIVEVIGRRIGFKKAAMTTVHAYTASQSLVDGPNKRLTPRPGGGREPGSDHHRRHAGHHARAARIRGPVRRHRRSGADRRRVQSPT